MSFATTVATPLCMSLPANVAHMYQVGSLGSKSVPTSRIMPSLDEADLVSQRLRCSVEIGLPKYTRIPFSASPFVSETTASAFVPGAAASPVSTLKGVGQLLVPVVFEVITSPF